MVMARLSEPPSVKSPPSNFKWVTGELKGDKQECYCVILLCLSLLMITAALMNGKVFHKCQAHQSACRLDATGQCKFQK